MGRSDPRSGDDGPGSLSDIFLPRPQPEHMRLSLPTFALISFSLGAGSLAVAQTGISDRQRADANRLIDAALRDSSGYARLSELTDRFGNRLSGSKALEDAISWILDKMKADGL